MNETWSRRNFLQTAGTAMGLAALAASTKQSLGEGENTTMPAKSEAMIWGYLIHLGYNMWGDREAPEMTLVNWAAKPYLRCDDQLWHDLFQKMKEGGINLAVIDLGEGIQYQSHPELAVKGSWSLGRLKEELALIRSLGIEPIPKLNFSTGHDAWLGEYSHSVSTEKYYQVCAELIAEVSTLFDHPRFFHLGMDEETFENQTSYAYAVIRQHDLWWHDFQFLVKEVEKWGARPWIWSDVYWRHPEAFDQHMPKSVVQGNWYYGESFKEGIREVKAYLDLEEKGYDQIPTGSNWSTDKNFGNMVSYLSGKISPTRLKGFLQTPWHPTLETFRTHHLNAVEQVRVAREAWEKKR